MILSPHPTTASFGVLRTLVGALMLISYAAYRIGWSQAMLHVLRVLDDEQKRAIAVCNRHGWPSEEALHAFVELVGRVAARTHQNEGR